MTYDISGERLFREKFGIASLPSIYLSIFANIATTRTQFSNRRSCNFNRWSLVIIFIVEEIVNLSCMKFWNFEFSTCVRIYNCWWLNLKIISGFSDLNILHPNSNSVIIFVNATQFSSFWRSFFCKCAKSNVLFNIRCLLQNFGFTFKYFQSGIYSSFSSWYCLMFPQTIHRSYSLLKSF